MDSGFREVMESLTKFFVPIGSTSKGELLTEDIREFPHLLVCGATGAGKSSFLHSLISSLVTHCPPEELRLLLCDTKVVEFPIYNGIPHLLVPAIPHADGIAQALTWAADECSRRLRLFREGGVRSLNAFNDNAWQEFFDELARIVVVVDDFASVVATNPGAANAMLTILQNGRIAGVHLVAATQTPTLKQVKRISLAMRSKMLFPTSQEDIRILTGARRSTIPIIPGDALAAVAGKPLTGLHTLVPTDVELDEIITSVKGESTSNYSTVVMEEIMEHTVNGLDPNESTHTDAALPGEDELLPAAVEIVLETGQASVSELQRRLKLGYARASRLVDEMEDLGIVGPFEGAKPRAVLISKAQWEQRQNAAPFSSNPPVAAETITCLRCGQACKSGYRFCIHCGARLK